MAELTRAEAIDQAKLLTQKNKSLSDQLDKITTQLFEANDQNAQLQKELAEKKHGEQLAAWAIDRALETMKCISNSKKISEMTNEEYSNLVSSSKVGLSTVAREIEVTNMAQHFCTWIKESSAKPTDTKEPA